jgi:hypothetical protein
VTGIPRRRPSTRWYLVAGLIAAIGLLSGVALLLAGGEEGTVDARLQPGEQATVALDAGRPSIVYTGTAEGSEKCTAASLGDGKITLDRLDEAPSVTPPGDDVTWRGIYRATVDRTGRYELTCGVRAPETSTGYAVGPEPARNSGWLIAVATGLALGGALASLVALGRRRVSRPAPTPADDAPQPG